MAKTIDKIDWSKISNKNSIQKKAIKEAVKKAGNCNRLAVLMKIYNPRIYKWVYRECARGQDLMHPASAVKMEKAVKIKGLTERLCPSQKK